MGLQFKELIIKKEITIENLRGKILAVDTYNNLYQYLTTIRGPDGSVLTDSQGRVTSHLIGLFNRTTSLMEAGIKLVFVFDGKPPAIKQKTWEKRAAVKQQASLRFQEAQEEGNVDEMRKMASRTARLTKEMLEDAKNVIRALGLPIVQAPSEGEAQTAYMVKQGKAYASVSQDYDNLIFGCPLLLRNLSIEGRRKKAGTLAYEKVHPEIISLKEVLSHLNLTLDQLIILAILIGTDYNPGGIKGIGPKTALKLVQEFKLNFDLLFEYVKWSQASPELSWQEIFTTIRQVPVTDDYVLSWSKIDETKALQLLVQEHNFSEERVKAKLEKIREVQGKGIQQGLGNFL